MRDENKLIAEFMNWSIEEWEGDKRLGDDDSDTFYIYDEEGNVFDEEDLLFHESWDWLMPVVERIEQTNEGCTLVIIEDERCYIDNQKGFKIDSVGHTKIEAVYNAVVNFIKNEKS
jgi:hypothetical protein